MAPRIYTKTGDKGETGLMGGRRVPKDDLRVETYGTVDELNAHIGVALTLPMPDTLRSPLAQIQSLLFELGGELATPSDSSKATTRIQASDITWMEEQIDRCQAELAPLRNFVLPGGSQTAAALHVARTVCRRAERLCVGLHRSYPQLNENTVVFLNRLSDLLFVLARFANHQAGHADTKWEPRQ